MAWTAPKTWTAGSVLTAAELNTHVRDNLLETLPAKASAAGQVGVATGANTIAARTCPSSIVSASEGVVATSYGAISGGTAGPTLSSLTTGATVFVLLSCNMTNSTGGAASYMSYAVSGDTTDASADTRALYYESSNAGDLIGFGSMFPHSVNAGTNTFTSQYKVGAGTGTFGSRRIAVLNFGS